MELRVLEYFLAVAREESITGAANALHISQPTLSRQLKELEEELGRQLFLRGSRHIELTEEGKILRKRAQEMMDLAEKAKGEIALSENRIVGDVVIGAGETAAVSYITDAAMRVKKHHPDVCFHIISGDDAYVKEMLDNGLIDLGLVFGGADYQKYDVLNLPQQDIWGVLMRKDDALAVKREIRLSDLADRPLIVSRQSRNSGILKSLLGQEESQLNIAGTYSLIFNGSLMVKSGLGYAVCLDHIINVSGESDLIFKPLSPKKTADICLIMKKNNLFSKAVKKFIDELQRSHYAIGT